MKVALLALWLVMIVGIARADDAPEPAKPEPFAPSEKVYTAVDTMCQGKRPEQLCKLGDGSGGMCVQVECPEKGTCLKCLSPETQKGESSLWIPMIAFGMTVTVVGAVFWLRLRKVWGSSS